MGRKGAVKRMNNVAVPEVPMALDEPMPDRWRRSQDHFTRLTELIRIELDDETEAVEERWKTWTKQRLLLAGVALFDLRARIQGRFFGEDIVVFEAQDGGRLPEHRFTHGDIVLISRSRPWGEKVVEGVVLDRGPTRLRVVVGERPKDVRKGGWRLDRGANRVAHDRMHEALITFHSTEGDGGTVLNELILGNVLDINQSATLPPDIRGRGTQRGPPPSLDGLNESQRNAVRAALERRMTLIQGPPGTGKTTTATHLLSVLAQQGSGPILATAESNVAVDNLLEGLLDLGVKALRIGRPVKVRETLRSATLDAVLENHPKQEELAFLQDEQRELRKSLPSLRGKEKGLMHRDINHNQREIRRLEDEMTASVLDEAEVICATTIGAGHRLLTSRKFPIVLMDEATQATEPSSLVPIVKGCRQLVLVGDHQQLPPTVISRRAEEGGLNRSLFDRLLACGLDSIMLTTQYRMHPILREFPSARFYENRLDDGCTRDQRPPPAGFLWPDWDRPMAFVPVEGVEESDEEGKSRYNRDEAAKVLGIVNDLLAAGDLQPEDIGVISPYNGQVRELTHLFDVAGGREPGEPYAGLEIKSVDGYQGREKEVIVFSTVRANDSGEVGFLADHRRLNVAVTRAKRGLVVLGHPTTLRHDPTWRSYLDWVDEHNLFAWHVTHMSS
ncbi:MAG: AAA domain-containing protein [Poseidonia sp.]